MAVDVITSNSMSHQTQAVTHLHRDINRRIVDATCVMRVLDIVEEASQHFNAVNISTAFHRLARMWRDMPDLTASASNGQARLDHALQTLMQLAVSHIKEVRVLCFCCSCLTLRLPCAFWNQYWKQRAVIPNLKSLPHTPMTAMMTTVHVACHMPHSTHSPDLQSEQT